MDLNLSCAILFKLVDKLICFLNSFVVINLKYFENSLFCLCNRNGSPIIVRFFYLNLNTLSLLEQALLTILLIYM